MLWTAPPPERECHGCGRLFFYSQFVQCMRLALARNGHPGPHAGCPLPGCRLNRSSDDLINATQGTGANLRDRFDWELRPFDVSRISLNGPDVLLGPKLVTAITLVVHELATNAAKYGALAGPTGRLDIVWSVTAGEMVIRWRESGELQLAHQDIRDLAHDFCRAS
jgi:hypothetical protein